MAGNVESKKSRRAENRNWAHLPGEMYALILMELPLHQFGKLILLCKDVEKKVRSIAQQKKFVREHFSLHRRVDATSLTVLVSISENDESEDPYFSTPSSSDNSVEWVKDYERQLLVLRPYENSAVVKPTDDDILKEICMEGAMDGLAYLTSGNVYSLALRCMEEFTRPLHGLVRHSLCFDTEHQLYKVLSSYALEKNYILKLKKGEQWKKIDDFFCPFRYGKILFNGAPHWIGRVEDRTFILAFDPKLEMFREINLPTEAAALATNADVIGVDDDLAQTHLLVVGGDLSVIQYSGGNEMKLFRLVDYMVQVWTEETIVVPGDDDWYWLYWNVLGSKEGDIFFYPSRMKWPIKMMKYSTITKAFETIVISAPENATEKAMSVELVMEHVENIIPLDLI